MKPVSKAHAEHPVGKLLGVKEGDDPIEAAEKAIALMKALGHPKAYIAEARRMLNQAVRREHTNSYRRH